MTGLQPAAPAGRWVIFNADDFGRSPGINRGVIEAHEDGLVTSASLMVRWPAAGEAAAYARRRPQLSVGLHVDLWECVYRDCAWHPVYLVVPLHDRAAVEAEVARQLREFRRLMRADPTHLDSHQHVHRREPLRSVLAALAATLGVPLRGAEPDIRYSGAFYGQTEDGQPIPDRTTPRGLIRTLAALPPGVTELSCHPGYADDLDTMYRAERAREVATLCHPAVRTVLPRLGIRLTSFARVPAALVAP